MSNSTPARKCFWFDETHATEHGFKVNIVTENEDGYMPTNVVLNLDYIMARVTVDNLNQQAFGLTEDEARAIVMSSMFPASRRKTVTLHLDVAVTVGVDFLRNEYHHDTDEAAIDDAKTLVPLLVRDAFNSAPWFTTYGDDVTVTVTSL